MAFSFLINKCLGPEGQLFTSFCLGRALLSFHSSVETKETTDATLNMSTLKSREIKQKHKALPESAETNVKKKN